MKKTVCILIAVLMALSVFSICTASALPEQDGNGRYRIDVLNGHAENDDCDTITYAYPGDIVYVYYDGDRVEGAYTAGISVNDAYSKGEFSFTMPNTVANVYFVFETQELLTIDLTGSGKAYVSVDDREEITSALYYVNGRMCLRLMEADLPEDL